MFIPKQNIMVVCDRFHIAQNYILMQHAHRHANPALTYKAGACWFTLTLKGASCVYGREMPTAKGPR